MSWLVTYIVGAFLTLGLCLFVSGDTRELIGSAWLLAALVLLWPLTLTFMTIMLAYGIYDVIFGPPLG